jgi:sulfur-oxidizing protein SoxZ
MASAIISLPAGIKRGEVFTVRALIQHPMETGYRRSSEGVLLARDLIRRFTCHFVEGGTRTSVFSADLHAAVAANPLIAFTLLAQKSGTLEFEWRGDNGFAHRESAVLKVIA